MPQLTLPDRERVPHSRGDRAATEQLPAEAFGGYGYDDGSGVDGERSLDVTAELTAKLLYGAFDQTDKDCVEH